ncbi:hypothetical protein P389DRAFT_102008 [Cystobasidium minutum MCA 4210]|uniref:uncharacterized protein n=1 Tax=Cystobasidium minutum MCA 4210 TaxID=1397322 RepID=UPI0034CE71F9|eukprot:jgi/Rhomi1/102008/CE102007_227
MGYDAEYAFVPSTVTSKAAFYDHVLESLKGLLALQQDGEKHDWVSALSSVSSVLFNSYADFPAHFGQARRVNWAGFYLIPAIYPSAASTSRAQLHDPSYLTIGPYQGRPGCLQIPLKNKRKGVCADSFLSRRTVTVQDVHQVPGHIACDASTECEIVVPLIYKASEYSQEGSSDEEQRSIAIGVLDIDCQSANSWSREDEEGLEKIVSWLMTPEGVVDWQSVCC